MKLIINKPIKFNFDADWQDFKQEFDHVYVSQDDKGTVHIMEQKVSLYEEYDFARLIDYLTSETEFDINDCTVYVEDCIRFVWG